MSRLLAMAVALLGAVGIGLAWFHQDIATAPSAPETARQPPEFTAGVHWHEIEIPDGARDAQSGGIVVTYFFSYAARDAGPVEDRIHEALAGLPPNVELQRVAVPLNAAWRRHARTFYALQAIGAEDAHRAMFGLVAERPQLALSPAAVARELLPAEKRAAFETAYDSADVLRDVAHAALMVRTWSIATIPAIVIGNRYLVRPEEVDLEVLPELLRQRVDAMEAPAGPADTPTRTVTAS